jgi:hypothetical protein
MIFAASIQQLCQSINDSHFGTYLRESEWAFPIVETIHVLSITLLVGTISALDLRLLGLLFRKERVSTVSRQVIPLTLTGAAMAFSSGLLLFWAEAAKSYGNPIFRIKLILLLLVGINPLIYYRTIHRKIEAWDSSVHPPFPAKIAGGVSLTLWAAIITAGRVIAYYN